MRYEQNSEVVYRNGLMAGLLAGCWCVLLIVSIGVALDTGEVLAAFVVLVAGGLVLAFFTYLLAVRPRVVLRRSEAEVYGYFFGSATVLYSAIEGVGFAGRFLGNRWLRIELADGSIVGVHPLMASGMLFIDPLWQRPLAAELERRAKQARRAVDVE